MDMKKILQTIDDAASKSAESSNDIKKFMTIINEGASPHKVSLPVQMAMQHYVEEPKITAHPAKESLIKKYFNEVEESFHQETVQKRQLINQYAKVIAERVQMKESAIPDHSLGFTGGVGPGLQSNQPTEDLENPKDIVKMDIPLLIRLLEYAREDAKTDMDLHNITEKLIDFSKEGDILTMDQYDAIVGEQKLLPEPTNEACWKGYQQVGMKKKGNKKVPNCVPKEK